MLKAALISGLVFGVVGGIPYINLLNCCCCSLIIATGFFAALLYSQDCKRVGSEFRPGTGAAVGLVSGLVGGFTSASLISLLILITGSEEATPEDVEWLIELLEQYGEVPPEVVEAIYQGVEVSAEYGPILMIPALFVILIVFGAIFATLGGLIGGAAFKVERASGY
jgi:hypothetical protein